MKKMLVIGFVIVAMLACLVACAAQQAPPAPLAEAPAVSTAVLPSVSTTAPAPAITAPASTGAVTPPESTAAPSSAVPPSSAVVPPSSSVVAPPESSVPPASGGFTNMGYSRALNPALSVPMAVCKMAGIERYEAWKLQFKHINPKGTRESYEHNVYNLIVELAVPREKIDAFHAEHPEIVLIPEKTLDMIYAKDKIGVYQLHLVENSFMVGELCFTPKWLVEHSVEEYVKAGITYEIFAANIDNSTNGCETQEQVKILEEKLEQLKNWKG